MMKNFLFTIAFLFATAMAGGVAATKATAATDKPWQFFLKGGPTVAVSHFFDNSEKPAVFLFGSKASVGYGPFYVSFSYLNGTKEQAEQEYAVTILPIIVGYSFGDSKQSEEKFNISGDLFAGYSIVNFVDDNATISRGIGALSNNLNFGDEYRGAVVGGSLAFNYKISDNSIITANNDFSFTFATHNSFLYQLNLAIEYGF